MKKIKVLALCDSPTCATGFAQVSQNILKRLHETGRYEIDVLGINFDGNYYDREKFPYRIYPAVHLNSANNDIYGRWKFMQTMTGGMAKVGIQPPWDIFFTIQDPFIIEGLGMNPHTDLAIRMRTYMEMARQQMPPEFWSMWVGYFPVDSDLKENWVVKSIALPDFPVAYCEWGKKKILEWDKPEYQYTVITTDLGGEEGQIKFELPSLKDRLLVIEHGCDVEDMHPISKEEIKKFRDEFFNGAINDETFLIVNTSRNQPRKDIQRTLQVYAKFREKYPNSHLYLHCDKSDIGGSIDQMAQVFNLVPGKEYSLPEAFDPGIGYSRETVNKIYNAADVLLTTTLGEGWGFITTEAMAVKKPIVAPYITSIIDIFGAWDQNKPLEEQELRGIPVLSGSNESEFMSFGPSDNERRRPLTNVTDAVEKLIWVKENPDKVKPIVDRAYEWVQKHDWNTIAKQWLAVFDTAYNTLEEKRKSIEKFKTASRNDLCPCGSGKKFKHCHRDVVMNRKEVKKHEKN